jgi:hypothetical protein
MQLKIQRSQREGGIAGYTVIFCLDVRADYSPEERANINRYKLGKEVVYLSAAARKHLDRAAQHLEGGGARGLLKGMASYALSNIHLTITVGSLGRGHHVECKDLEEMMEAEDAIRQSGKKVTGYLALADTFNGSETLITYEAGQEIIHIQPSAEQLFLPAPGTVAAISSGAPSTDAPLLDHFLHWLETPMNVGIFLGAIVLVLIIIARLALN